MHSKDSRHVRKLRSAEFGHEKAAGSKQTGALGGDPPLPGEDGLSGPSEELLAMWAQLGESRTREQEVAFNLEHWRVLSGAAAGGHFDADEFRALEERVRAHTGHHDPIAAHALHGQVVDRVMSASRFEKSK